MTSLHYSLFFVGFQPSIVIMQYTVMNQYLPFLRLEPKVITTQYVVTVINAKKKKKICQWSVL